MQLLNGHFNFFRFEMQTGVFESPAGTIAFAANGWRGAFYPRGMKPPEFLNYYSTKFKTVEIDSTYYGTPSAETVTGWYEKTTPDFIFAAKVPQVMTHDKVQYW